jgi:hypothetical protein
MLIPHEFACSVPHFGWEFYDIDLGFRLIQPFSTHDGRKIRNQHKMLGSSF